MYHCVFNMKMYHPKVFDQICSIQSFSICLSGDEGQALGGTYMAFHWQSDLSPVLKNAGLSRFMITTIPSTFYVSWPAINVSGEFVKFKIFAVQNVSNRSIFTMFSFQQHTPNRSMMVLSI